MVVALLPPDSFSFGVYGRLKMGTMDTEQVGGSPSEGGGSRHF